MRLILPGALFQDLGLGGLEQMGRMVIEGDMPAHLLDPTLDEDMYKHVLSEEGEQQLERNIVTAGETVTCCFSQEPLDVGVHTVTLPCKHVFAAEPIEKWLREEKAQCPICRHALPSKEVRNLPSPVLTPPSQAMDVDGEPNSPPGPPIGPMPPVLSLLQNMLSAQAEQRAAAEEERMLQEALLDIYTSA